MRCRELLAVALLSVAWAGCSTDTSGLADELPLEDSSSDDTSSSSDETSIDTDSSTPDTTVVDSGSPADTTTTDTLVADVADTTVADTTVDDVADTAVADTMVADTGPTLTSDPGNIVCSPTSCGKKFCCGAPKFSGGYDWQCTDNCGFFGIGSLDYACDEKADCGSGQVCCVSLQPFSTTWAGSSCRASCGSDPQLCTTNAECGGKTCTLTKVASATFSYGVCK